MFLGAVWGLAGAGGLFAAVENGPPFTIGLCASPAAAGFDKLAPDSYREDFGWEKFEPKLGEFRLPRAFRTELQSNVSAGYRPLFVLAYGHAGVDRALYPVTPEGRAAFAGYAGRAVRALGSLTGWWEVWNEWNYSIGMPSGTPPGKPEDYVRLLAETYPAVKRRAPKSVVLGGAMALDGRKDEWLRRACEAGLLEHLDGLSFHPYAFAETLDTERRPETRMLAQLAHVESVIAPFEKRLGRRIPFYITEIGWSSLAPYQNLQFAQQAENLARGLLLLRAHPRVRGFWIFKLADSDSQSNAPSDHLGLLYDDGSPKPAFGVVRETLSLIRQARSASVCEDLLADTGDSVHAVRLTGFDGRIHLAVWCEDANESWQVAVETRSPDPRLRQWLIGSKPAALPVASRQSENKNAVVRLTVGSLPLIIGPLDPATRFLEGALLR